jgi:hypothetical protein
VVALVWSVLLGVIIAVIGFVAFGGFPKREVVLTQESAVSRWVPRRAEVARR